MTMVWLWDKSHLVLQNGGNNVGQAVEHFRQRVLAPSGHALRRGGHPPGRAGASPRRGPDGPEEGGDAMDVMRGS